MNQKTELALDTETTGLRWNDEIFSIIIADAHNEYYFNFNGTLDYFGRRPPIVLNNPQGLRPLIHNPAITWYIHNGKFDDRMLRKWDLHIAGDIHCTQTAARLIYNDFDGYSLDKCAERELGTRKDDAVMQFIKNAHKLTPKEREHNKKSTAQNNKLRAQGIPLVDKIKHEKCYTMEAIPGKKTRTKRLHFNLVPWDIIVPYGCKDARLHYELGRSQLDALKKRPVWDLEKKIAKICVDMELHGMRIDTQYCKRALSYEQDLQAKAELEWCKMTGQEEFIDGKLGLVEAFKKFDLKYPLTEKGNPSFREDVLDKIDNPIANLIKKIRGHKKAAGTYYSSFLHYKDEHDIIRADFNPTRARTGRFSSSNPNLQNVTKQAEPGHEYYVRKCFIPPKDFVLFNPDYDGQEFRMMLDYAGQQDLISEINGGKDPHQATADLAGITRSQAKTMNYMLVYGGGVKKLSELLGVIFKMAKALHASYFSKLPKIKAFIKGCQKIAKQRGVVRTWAGRYMFFNGMNEGLEYKAANSVIQGGCGDVVKYAMVACHEYLKPYKSYMNLQVHDELGFCIHKDEFHVCQKLMDIMAGVYKPYNGMPLTCSASWSPTSWGYPDKLEGLPDTKELDNVLQMG